MTRTVTVAATLMLAIALMLTVMAARAVAADDDAPAPRFRPWQRIWQCNDIRVTETVNQPGTVNYDLGGTIWGGSNFTLNFQRGDLFFNGRPCLQLR